MIKRLLLLIILIITPIIVLAYPIGDVDGDNKVGVGDYLLIRKHLLKISLLTGDKLTRADVDGKNGVTTADYILIRKIILRTVTITPSPVVTITPTTSEGICESIKNNASIDYKSFASLKKDNDDYYVIKAAHDCANKYNKPVVITKGVYNIYNKTNDNIVVKTDTDLNYSTIYIHDEKGIVGTSYSNHIYKISYDGYRYKEITVGDIKQGSVIDELKGSINGYYVRITDLNENRRNFIRYGSNANSGKQVMDSSRVDKDGKIIDPLFWSYNKSKVKIAYSSIPSTTLTFKNATIYTIIDTDTSRNVQSSSSSKYLRRGILINRSNTVIQNIKHIIINSAKSEVLQSNHGYYGFFAVQDAANVTLKDLRVSSVKNNNVNVNSTYDIILDNVANVTIKNVLAGDYDGNSSYFNKSSNLLKADIWGMTASNNAKNISYDGCVLNRIDAHTGTYNLTVKNTILGRHAFTLNGYGDLVIENVAVYYTNTFVKLRDDYGSVWKGNVKIKNSSITPSNNNEVVLINYNLGKDGSYIHNFGYDLSLPNVTINGFKVNNTSNKLNVFSRWGDVTKVKNMIKNNAFKFTYPTKDNIKVSDVKNANGKAIKIVDNIYSR